MIYLLLDINGSSTAVWLLGILALSISFFIFYKIDVRKRWHKQQENEGNILRLEALLFHSKEMEKKAAEEISHLQLFYKQLLSKLNHEVRNPLNGVTGMSTLLEGTALTGEQSGYVQSIRHCSSALVTAIHHLFNSAGIAVADEKPAKETTSSQEKTVKPVLRLSDGFAKIHPLKILVAEDDVLNQQLALMILKKLGYLADIAPNGKEVLEMISECTYDLILMDVQMPEMDGLETTRMIRLCLSTQPVIIAMTANAMEGDREACLTSGMDDYISKPVNVEELMEKLEESVSALKKKNRSKTAK